LTGFRGHGLNKDSREKGGMRPEHFLQGADSIPVIPQNQEGL